MTRSTRDETFRGTMQAATADSSDPATVIVTRQGTGGAARVWLTQHGSIRATIVMTDAQTRQLVELLGNARAAR